jgi:DNA polymerase III gamma/tau subunit
MSLASKLKPNTFKEVLGQDETINYLKSAIKLYKPNSSIPFPESLIISGPSGTGKTTLALLFIKAFKCLNRKVSEFEPCNNCSVCDRLNREVPLTGIDNYFFTAGVNNTALIEDITKICEAKPVDNNSIDNQHRRRKFIVIDEAQFLEKKHYSHLLNYLSTASAYNTTWIFCTMQLDILDPMLRSALESRSIICKLNKISEQTIINSLSLKYPGVSVQTFKLLAKVSNGNFRQVWATLSKLETIKTAELSDELENINLFFTEEDIYSLVKLPREEERLLFLSNCSNTTELNATWENWCQHMSPNELVNLLTDDLWSDYIKAPCDKKRNLILQLQLWSSSSQLYNPLFLFNTYGKDIIISKQINLVEKILDKTSLELFNIFFGK